MTYGFIAASVDCPLPAPPVLAVVPPPPVLAVVPPPLPLVLHRSVVQEVQAEPSAAHVALVPHDRVVTEKVSISTNDTDLNPNQTK